MSSLLPGMTAQAPLLSCIYWSFLHIISSCPEIPKDAPKEDGEMKNVWLDTFSLVDDEPVQCYLSMTMFISVLRFNSFAAVIEFKKCQC